MTDNEIPVSTGPGGSAPPAVTTAPRPAQSSDGDERGLFRVDTAPRSIVNAIREYVARLRGGDPGALPAVLGLLVLGVIFASTTPDFASA